MSTAAWPGDELTPNLLLIQHDCPSLTCCPLNTADMLPTRCPPPLLQGVPQAPMCGFSNMACAILNLYGACCRCWLLLLLLALMDKCCLTGSMLLLFGSLWQAMDWCRADVLR